MNNNLLEILMLAQNKADPQLALHSKRVSCFSYELAKLLNKDKKFQQEILLAGLLHDIGFLKIDIDFSNVPLRLAQNSDLDLIKSHTIEGLNLTKTLIKKKTVLQVIRSHHEKYNGEGYPDQLEGEDIPLSARIVAVADFYDTLLVGEMFGDRRSIPEQVKNKLIEVKGQHLDPEITERLLDLLHKIPVLYQPTKNNKLKLYSMHYLELGVLELGDLINQDGNIILSQGSRIEQATLDKIQNDYPGQKIIIPRLVDDTTSNEKF